MFIVYVQCNGEGCHRKAWSKDAERDWVNAKTGKPLGRRYRARHGEGKHLCPECQEKIVMEQAADLQTKIEAADLPEAESAEGLVLRPVGSHSTNPFTPKPQAQPDTGDPATED